MFVKTIKIKKKKRSNESRKLSDRAVMTESEAEN